MALARHCGKLGQLSTGFVESGCACSRIAGLGLIGSDQRIPGELEGSQGTILRLHFMKTFGHLVGCSTELTRTNKDRGALLEGVHNFYSKRHLGKSIRITGQGVAHKQQDTLL